MVKTIRQFYCRIFFIAESLSKRFGNFIAESQTVIVLIKKRKAFFFKKGLKAHGSKAAKLLALSVVLPQKNY